MAESTQTSRRRQLIGGAVLGVALGGFFDGILLHQVLQWHHLLSLVPGESLRDIRTQILADGLFHVLMYVVAAIGLWLLWRARHPGASDHYRLLASVSLGFGIWQFVDVVLFHWIVRIHRIRVDVPDPLAWDLGWLLVFGVPAIAASWWLFAKARRDPPPSTELRLTPTALLMAVLVTGALALLPSPGPRATVVLFPSSYSPAAAFAAIAAAGGEITWADPSGRMVALDTARTVSWYSLYRRGAIVVGSGALPGCASWTKV